MLRQTLAIFVDAYRELNARKMFWIVLVISGLVVLAFAAVGINERGITILHWEFDAPFNTSLIPRDTFYKLLFVVLGIGFWLTWAATILALISTAGMFPEFISGGAIDLYLSKPISRLRLFLTKYAAGLLFVTLQVLVFSAASFILIGIRGDAWEPGLFLAVPIVVCFYSYLFAVCVLVGVLTRSTVASILLTVLFWMLVLGIHITEVQLLKMKVMSQQIAERADRAIVNAQTELRLLKSSTAAPEDRARRTAKAEERLKSAEERKAKESGRYDQIHKVFVALKTPLPKTSETVQLLQRWLVEAAALTEVPSEQDVAEEESARRDAFGRPIRESLAEAEVERVVNTRSPKWVIGTSLGFEAVVLALAAWVFCRRDY